MDSPPLKSPHPRQGFCFLPAPAQGASAHRGHSGTQKTISGPLLDSPSSRDTELSAPFQGAFPSAAPEGGAGHQPAVCTHWDSRTLTRGSQEAFSPSNGVPTEPTRQTTWRIPGALLSPCCPHPEKGDRMAVPGLHGGQRKGWGRTVTRPGSPGSGGQGQWDSGFELALRGLPNVERHFRTPPPTAIKQKPAASSESQTVSNWEPGPRASASTGDRSLVVGAGVSGTPFPSLLPGLPILEGHVQVFLNGIKKVFTLCPLLKQQ